MSAAPGVLLVGSIPLDTSEAVFEMFGRPLGAQLSTLPDGETGPRRRPGSLRAPLPVSGTPLQKWVSSLTTQDP